MIGRVLPGGARAIAASGSRLALGVLALGVLALASAAVAFPPGSAATVPSPTYVPPRSTLLTPWTRGVSAVAPLPDYPRPQLERSRWLSLNGRWQYSAAQAGQAPPFGHRLSETILVPFAPEAPLSGIRREDLRGWYRRQFAVPADWHGDHVLLNFGAVSWRAVVYVNGHLAGTHDGDYDSFSVDITRSLRPRGANELIVGFDDPVGGAGEPVGKQIVGAPRGFLHTAVTGIWQTVWLEPVSAQHISALQLIPELGRGELVITPTVAGAGASTLTATALATGRVVANATVATAPTGRLVLRIPHPHEWSPWDPYLYGLRVELVSHGHVLDTVDSYFGMRSVALGRVGGAVRVLLDGRFVFESGALDQGYWPDGLYTPPADAAMQFDILAAKRLGFDMLREHEKVEPDRWYYWADRLGMLVWQDMPSGSLNPATAPTPPGRAEYRTELARIVAQHRSDPSVVMWIPFNEGWGEFDPAGVTAEIHSLAPGELVDTDSGSANCCGVQESPATDVLDTHLYSGPFSVPADRRASVIGEYGAVLPYPPVGHRWPGVLTSIGSPVLAWPLAPAGDLLHAQYAALTEEMRLRGLSGAVFTELSGYEQELGILTYDRQVFTIPAAVLRPLNDALIAASRSTAELRPQPPRIPPGADGDWGFAEGAGTSAADSVGHHTLTLEGGTGWTSGPTLSGHPSGALSITATGEDAVTASPVIDTSHSFSISVWLKAAAAGESGTAVSEPGPDGSSFSVGIQTSQQRARSDTGSPSAPPATATWWTFVTPASSNCTSLACGVRANTRYDDGRFSPSPGSWHQLTAVYDTVSQSIALYVDGVPEDIEHVFGIPAARGPLTVGEGDRDYSPADSFIGAIGELRTWARALTPTEVWQLYRQDAG